MIKKLTIISDAWTPQVNGVVQTLQKTIEECEKRDFFVDVISPNNFKYSIPCPSYKSIRLAIPDKKTIIKKLSLHKPDYIHIATEGPIGITTAKILKDKKVNYTTSYHTKFPQYMAMRIPFLKEQHIYSFLYSNIHEHSSAILVTNESMKKELELNNFESEKMIIWGRGVDTNKFTWKGYNNQGKNLLYVGRIAKEKNIEEMLECIILTPFKINIVGDGPDLKKLKKKYIKYRNINFLGEKVGEELVSEYHKADIFVFPSKADTFGIVQVEAMACGLPVAALNVIGPKDIITNHVNGYVSDNLLHSINHCVKIDSKKCSDSVQHLTWENVSSIFIDTLCKAKEFNW